MSLRRILAIIGFCLLASLQPVTAAIHEATSQSGQITVAEAIGALPLCAKPCLKAAMGNSSCGLDDFDCLCKDPKYYADSAFCVHQQCTVRQTLTTKNLTYEMCGHPSEGDGSLLPTFFTFFSLAILAVALRLIARILTSAFLGWDDVANFAAAATCAAFTVLNIYLIKNGLGKDLWFVEFEAITKILQLFYANMLLYTLTRFFCRMSIILFYMRIFPASDSTNARLSKLILGSLIFNFVYNLSFFIAVMFQCQPISFYWFDWEANQPDSAHPMQGKCGNGQILAWVAATTGIAFDLWLIALPFPALLSLNLHWKKKAMAGAMFMVGAAVIIISFVRLKTINQFTRTANPTKDTADLCLWSGIELDFGVICPCLPSFRLLFKRFFPDAMGSSQQYQLDPVSNQIGTKKSKGRIHVTGNLTVEISAGPNAGGGGGFSRPTKEVYDGRSFESVAGLVPDSKEVVHGDEESQKTRDTSRY
ncbi:hypothetical protein QBC38DRAFT_525178 [Podospora fimiseda]|uniref:CFEM domain-containing protein n=1 Tax=Podospora fimiseda TaxID=252190 RepID=A0AAN7BED8_9PEZI|nr:hypothetical protein QBC38DRAFT_525178 [Podospora fimiseda]